MTFIYKGGKGHMSVSMKSAETSIMSALRKQYGYFTVGQPHILNYTL